MYKGDEVVLSYGKASNTIAVKSGIRQGGPLSPALFSALMGHTMRPLITNWERKGWGAENGAEETQQRNHGLGLRGRRSDVRGHENPSQHDAE